MIFRDYFHEGPERRVARRLAKYRGTAHKVNVWNAFVDSDLSGVTDDDFSVFPRVLPASYLPVIKRTAFKITEFALRLLSLPEAEIRAIVPPGPIRDHLLDELQVVKYRKERITGSFRFDMAIVGPPDEFHPPLLLEINEIGFDGLARSTFFQNSLLRLMPELRGRLRGLDTAAAEVRNMQRLGSSIARIQYDSYNWDEEYLRQTAQRLGVKLRLISPTLFGAKPDKDFPYLEIKKLAVKNGRAVAGDWRPDALNMSFAYELSDYREGHELYKKIVRSSTPQYGPFLTGLVAAKTILVLLADPALRRRLLGSGSVLRDSILPAHLLIDTPYSAKELGKEWVVKHTDGCGGEQVFMNQELIRQLRRTPKSRMHEWVLQKKTHLNLVDVNGVLSRPKRAIADLGVFVQYDWSHGRFHHLEVGGLMARATNKSLKVNVSGGGLQVAVLLDRGS